MRCVRSLVLFALLGLASLGVLAATPQKAEAYYYNPYGAYYYPYYWSGYNYYPYYRNYYYGYRPYYTGYYNNPYSIFY